MIRVGLTGWGDHDSLYPKRTGAGKKLPLYSKYFSIVEIDASFYAVQRQENYEKWVAQTPENFVFVIKPQQAVTGHKRGLTIAELKEEIQRFRNSIAPVVAANKLKAVLLQFPPQFDCAPKNIAYLRFVKEQFQETPCALEFRNQTWFSDYNRAQTLQFMRDEGWIHVIVDEPQVGMGSSPTVLEATHPEVTLVRFHGRNHSGWNPENKENWREVRFLYRYNEAELQEWAEAAQNLEKECREICLVFNNNSGGDAADNAREMMGLLGIDYNEEVASQLALF